MDIIIELHSGANIITAEPAKCSITRAVCNDSLQHVEDSCDVKLAYDPDLLAFLVSHGQIGAVVKKRDGSVLFTGIAGTDASWTDRGEPFPVRDLSLSVKDFTAKLDVTNEKEIALHNAPLAVVISRLAEDCGIRTIPDQAPSAVLEAFVMPPGKNYRQTLDALCFQYRACFYFDNDGALNLFYFGDIPDAAMEPLGESDMLAGAKVRKSRKRYDRVTIEYNTLVWKNNEQIFFESFGYDSDNKPSPVVLQPGVYYPFDSAPEIESTEGQVYQSFVSGYAESRKKYNGELEYRRSKDTSLLYTRNHKVVEDWEGSIQINRTEFETLRASVRFRNTGADDAKLRQFAIRADALYRNKSATVSAGGAATGEGDRTFASAAEFIYQAAHAEALANALFRFFSRSCFSVEFSTDAELISPGSYRSIDAGKSGLTVDALICSYTLDCEKEIYSYKALSVGPAAVDVTRFKNAEPGPLAAGQRLFVTYYDGDWEPQRPQGDGQGDGWHYAHTAQAQWQSSKTAETAGTGEWGAPVRIKGEREHTDTVAVFLALSRQNVVLETDSGGNIIAGLLPFTVQADLFKWNYKLPVTTGIPKYPGSGTNLYDPMLGEFFPAERERDIAFSLQNAPPGVTINNNGVITAAANAALGDEHSITVKAVYQGNTYTAALSIKINKKWNGEALYLGTVSVLPEGPEVTILNGRFAGPVRALQYNYVLAVASGGSGSWAWTAGYVYQWTGVTWKKCEPGQYSSLYMNCFEDGLEVPGLTTDMGWFGNLFAGALFAQQAYIRRLEAVIVKITGVIYGGDRYDKDGVVVDAVKNGWWLGPNGLLKAAGGEFTGKITANEGSFKGELQARSIEVTGTVSSGTEYILRSNNTLSIVDSYNGSWISATFDAVAKEIRTLAKGSCLIRLRFPSVASISMNNRNVGRYKIVVNDTLIRDWSNYTVDTDIDIPGIQLPNGVNVVKLYGVPATAGNATSFGFYNSVFELRCNQNPLFLAMLG